MEVLRSFPLHEKNDVQQLTVFLRTFCDTTTGVPLSLACSASYLEFRIECLKACDQKACETKPKQFDAFLGNEIYVAYRDSTVTVSRRLLHTHKSLPSNPGACTAQTLSASASEEEAEAEEEAEDEFETVN